MARNSEPVILMPRRPLLLTVREAAAELSISEDLCRKLINAGKLPIIRLHDDGDARVPSDLLERLIKQKGAAWAAIWLEPEPEPVQLPKRGRRDA